MIETKRYQVPVLFTAPSGSRLYGTATEGSDIDSIVVYLPTKEMLYAEVVPPSHHAIVGKEDVRYWSLPKFLKLMAKGDMVALETRSYLMSEIFKESIKDNAALIRVISEVCRFACHFPTSIGNQVGEYLRSLIRARYENISVVDTRKSSTWGRDLKIVEGGRMEGTKAYHMARLVYQALKLTRDGEMSFPTEHAEWFRHIKAGTESPAVFLIQMQKDFEDQWLRVFGLDTQPNQIQLSNGISREFETWSYHNLIPKLILIGAWIDAQLGSKVSTLPTAVV